MAKTFRYLQDEMAKMDTFRIGTLQDRISEVLDSARVNADDTVYVEKAAPVEQYDAIAIDTLRGILSSNEYSSDKRLANWFAKRGIKA